MAVFLSKGLEKVKFTNIEFDGKYEHVLLPTPIPDTITLHELKVAIVFASAKFIRAGKSILILGVWVKGWPKVIEKVYDDKSPIVVIDGTNDTWVANMGETNG